METIIKRKRGGAPIEEHHLNCLKCGHDHTNSGIIKHYNKQASSTMHFVCDECNYPMRISTTRRGFYVFSNQSTYRYEAKKWNDILRHAPFKVTTEMYTWFSDNYYPARKKNN